jgi:hypothetical protein
MARNAWQGDRGGAFYLLFALTAVVATLVGFSTTYFIPVATRQFAGPVAAHLHGLFLFGWIGLLLLQAWLARQKRIRTHQRFGLAMLPCAVAMAATGIGVGMFAVRRDLAAGVGDAAYSQLGGVVTAMSLLLVFTAIAFAMRRRPDWHKRMILLATVAVLWPAWFRWRHLMPWLPRPDIWLSVVVPDAMILAAALRDRLRFGHIHPAYLIFGSLLIAENVAELLLFDSPLWRAATKAMFDLAATIY